MSKKSINIQGLSTMPNHRDGECLQITNARWKNGALRPVVPIGKAKNKEGQDIDLHHEYQLLFMHDLPNNEQNNLIGVASSASATGSIVVWEKEDGTTETIGTFGGIKINSIEQNGNLLVLFTDNTEMGIVYFIWKDGYNKVMVDADSTVKVNIKLGNENVSTGNIVINPGESIEYNTSRNRWTVLHNVYENPSNKEVAQSIIGTVFGHEKEYFSLYPMFEPVLLMCSYKLYDGNYINVFTPTLIMPPKKISGTQNYPFDSGNYQYSYNIQDLIFYNDQPHYSAHHVRHVFYRYSIEAEVDLSKVDKNIISSVDFFMAPIEVLKIDYLRDNYYTNITTAEYNENGVDFYIKEYTYISSKQEIFENIIKEFDNIDNFYKIFSISTEKGGVQTYLFPNKQNEIKSKEDLRNQPDENIINLLNFNQHSAYNKTITFNKRIHAIGRKRDSGLGNLFFKSLIAVEPHSDNPTYNGIKWTYKEDGDYIYYLRITRDGKEFTEKLTGEVLNSFSTQAFIGVTGAADKLEIIRTQQGDSDYYIVAETELKRHPHFDISYAVNTETDGAGDTFISSNFLRTGMQQVTGEPASNVESEENNQTLYVFETSNPFMQNPDNTYEFDNTILALASNKLAVSDRNFGQFPLYVFTTGGIFMLQVSGNASLAYSQIITPTSHSLPISDVVENTPYGVAFITEKGVMLINGQEIINISEKMELPTGGEVLPQALIEKIPNNREYDFVEHCRAATDICYNHYENELVVMNIAKDYCFVYNFSSKHWYQSSVQYKTRVKNSYPEILVAYGNDLRSFSEKETGAGDVTIVTRPVYFGIDEVKKVQRAILRGKFYNAREIEDKTLLAALTGSNDGEHQELLRGLVIPQEKQGRDYKDFDLGLMARTSKRNYSVVLSGKFDERTEIQGVDFEVADNYGNDKMR